MLKLFGFEIRREADEKPEDQPTSFAEPLNDDGAITVGTALGGSYSVLLDMEGGAKTEAELVTKYRQMFLQPEIQQGVEEIVNEAISVDSHDEVVKVVLDDVDLPDKAKKAIINEFKEVLRLLDFSNSGYETFQRWYVDGRLNYHVIIDKKNVKDGIKELRYVDPRKLRMVREIDDQVKDKWTGVNTKRVRKEYYVYAENGFGALQQNQAKPFMSSQIGQQQAGFRIAKDSIVRVTSGLMNENNSMVLSYLHKSIKPLNQLKMLEDATVIYTLTRAPERRVFYIDVGNLPKAKAEQYLHDMMARHKNKLQYDSSTGEITDARKMMTMTEDFWFPRREGNRATEIESLPGGTSLKDNDNLEYFQSKLAKSMGVPIGRLMPETMFSLGRSNETSREEFKFGKFIKRLRSRFSTLFDQCLEKQLILKGILTPEEWLDIKDQVRYDFQEDNHFEQLKEAEVLRERAATARDLQDYIGTYFSHQWVMQNIFYMTEDEIKEMRKQIEEERNDGFYKQPGEEELDGEGGSRYGDGQPDDPAISGVQRPVQPQLPPEEPRPDDGEQPAEEGLDVINKSNPTR